MARSAGSRRAARPADLTRTLERLALLLGDRIGAGIARALAAPPAPPPHVQEGATAKKRCTHAGCTRDAAAKGLCKSHYNLMLYHRRKAERGPGGERGKRPRAIGRPKAGRS